MKRIGSSSSKWLSKADGGRSFILRSQEWIQWADHLISAHPIWWSSMPSLMKGWIDRVFTLGLPTG